MVRGLLTLVSLGLTLLVIVHSQGGLDASLSSLLGHPVVTPDHLSASVESFTSSLTAHWASFVTWAHLAR